RKDQAPDWQPARRQPDRHPRIADRHSGVRGDHGGTSRTDGPCVWLERSEIRRRVADDHAARPDLPEPLHRLRSLSRRSARAGDRRSEGAAAFGQERKHHRRASSSGGPADRNTAAMTNRVRLFPALALAMVAAWGQAADWSATLAKARGQTVNFNAWAGDEKTNAFIAWIGSEVDRRYGVKVNHVKLKDTAEAVTRVVAEKAAGRDSGGRVDLVWITRPNFLALKEQRLLHGPFATALPNYRYVDTTSIRSNTVDFTIPVDGMESPWRRAQIVFVYDGKRVADAPRSVAALLEWAKRNPGRTTH